MISLSRASLFGRLAAHLLFACGMVIVFALSNPKYSWIHEMEPSVSSSEILDDSNNRALFTLVLLVLITSPQLAIVLRSSNRTEKALSMSLILVSVTLGIAYR